MTTRLGIIGAGKWGQRIIQACLKRQDVDVVAVACRSEAHRDHIPAGAQFYTDWSALVASGSVDAIITATPPALNSQIVKSVLQNNLPVQVEKPFALNLSDAESIVEDINNYSGRLQVGYIDRYNEAWKVLRQRLPGLGQLISMTAAFGGNGPVRNDISALWDWGSHPLALMIDLLGMPVDISATYSRNEILASGSIDNIDIELAYDGISASIKTGNGFDQAVRRFAVTCEKGTITYDDRADDKLVIKLNDGSMETVRLENKSPLENEIESFLGLIKTSSSYSDDAMLGLNVTTVLTRIESCLQRSQGVD